MMRHPGAAGQGDRPHAKSKLSRTLKTMERCGLVRFEKSKGGTLVHWCRVRTTRRGARRVAAHIAHGAAHARASAGHRAGTQAPRV
jgi:hypothetical protein